MRQYTSDEILKLVSLRTAILKSHGFSDKQIQGDLEGYTRFLNNPELHKNPGKFEEFVKNQLWVYERTKGTW